MKISVVIPVCNEEHNVVMLYHELVGVFAGADPILEIIFINDASTDKTLEQITALAKADNRVLVINLTTNSGQSYATMQGIQAATGELTAFLDGDMQNDASDLPKMINRLYEGYDLVCGWRKDRKDKASLVVSSQMANTVIRSLFGVEIHDTGCSLRVGYAEHLKKIKFFKNFHRYIPVILAKQKMRVTEMVVNHRARAAGQSKYNITKSLRVMSELVYLRFFY